MDELARRWGQVIRQRRTLMGMSQQALAEAVGVTQPAVSAWELGERCVSRRHLPVVRDVLGLPRDAFDDRIAA